MCMHQMVQDAVAIFFTGMYSSRAPSVQTAWVLPREGKGGSGEPGAARVSCPAESVCLGVTVNDTRTKRVFYTLQLASLWSSLLQTCCGFLSLISSRVSISLLKYH